MRVGFTGTQRGMTPGQRDRFRATLLELVDAPGPHEFHHGDCIGADAQGAEIARELGFKLVAHPPTNDYKRAFVKSDASWTPKPYLARNHEIVDAVELMIATPGEHTEQLRSGTWATIRYARRQRKPLKELMP